MPVCNAICFEKRQLFIILLIIVALGIYSIYYFNNNSKYDNYKSRKKLERDVENLSNKIYNNQEPIIINNTPPMDVINRSPQQINSLDRVYNPLRYPYRSHDFYNQNWYPNLALPPQVIGCGARTMPCLGGSQIPIMNPMPPISISNSNIAPINISTRGPLGEPQQVGAIYRVFGSENHVLPLFGRRKYPNDNKWEYYTMAGQYGVKMPLITPRKHWELGTNDLVFVQGQRRVPYRVTMYEQDSPQYIPYL